MNRDRKWQAYLWGAVALGSSLSVNAVEKDEYVETVMDVLRTHIALLEEMSTAHRFRYSDNLVRHAMAIQHTFGLLGPMEWHAAESAKIRSKLQGTEIHLDEERFERLAKRSQQSIRDLVRKAHDTMEEHDRDGLLRSIEEFKQACNDCHQLLPKAVAPDLWSKLERN